jgi:hypothetical protein
MIDIQRLLAQLIQTIRTADFPNVDEISGLLDLDVSQARITKANSGLSINGAYWRSERTTVGLVCGTSPRREIWVLPNKISLPYRSIEEKIFGANQRVIPSRFDGGLGVVFEIGGLTCGYTAQSPQGDVEGFFCEEPASSAQVSESHTSRSRVL